MTILDSYTVYGGTSDGWAVIVLTCRTCGERVLATHEGDGEDGDVALGKLVAEARRHHVIHADSPEGAPPAPRARTYGTPRPPATP